MREIKFRGKRVDNGEWAYGVPQVTEISGVYMVWSKLVTSQRRDGSMSVYDKVEQAEVAPETVGQYTGIKDKNGVEIYEGDVLCERNVQQWENFKKEDGSEWRKLTENYKDEKAVMLWDERKAQFVTALPIGWFWTHMENIEVIGNIHDNPELLEVEQ